MLRLYDFAGTWAIARRIDDRRAGRIGHLTGRATFTPEAEGHFRYAEEGTLQFPGQPDLTARQTYLWHAVDTGIAVHFADGRPFHHIALGQPHPATRHDCAPDTYDVIYDFATWPDWSAEWTVSGPHKNYSMKTRYRRTADLLPT